VKTSYSSKLKDPRWQKKRLKILERDNFTCQDCRSADSELHVHHLVYMARRDPWDYGDDLLRTLCESCHARRQEVEQDFKQVAPSFSTPALRSVTCALNAMLGFMDEDAIVSLLLKETARFFPEDVTAG
jgi:hypothetical protein